VNEPVFQIHIGKNSNESRVVCNGHDISAAVRKITVTLEAGALPVLELTAAYGSAEAEIKAAIADVRVVPRQDDTPRVHRPEGR